MATDVYKAYRNLAVGGGFLLLLIPKTTDATSDLVEEGDVFLTIG